MKVRAYECDLQCIVNNANYQHYMEHARHEFLEKVGANFGKYNRICNSGNETGTVRFRSPKGICSEKYRSSASLYERKRILCCVSGKISKVIIHKTKKMQRCILSTIIHFCIFLF